MQVQHRTHEVSMVGNFIAEMREGKVLTFPSHFLKNITTDTGGRTMKDATLFLSRFAHFFAGQSLIACYHSLRMMPVFISAELLPIIKKFKGGACPEDLLGDPKERDDFLSIIKVLKDARILIQNPIEDDQALEYFLGLLGKPYPHLAYFLLTEKCNFRCGYCFIKNQATIGYKERHMTQETALKGLDFFCRMIQKDPEQFEMEKTIVFYGGEPLMNWPVFEMLLSKIRNYKEIGKLPEKTILNLVTNGTLLTDRIARILMDNNVQISISIDGDELATNSFRVYTNGKPVYQDIKNGFKICKDLGMDIGASCTLSEANISDFDTTIRILLDECMVTNMGLNLMITGNQEIVKDYNEKAAQFIIKAFQIFRERGVYEDRIMRKVNAFVEKKVWPFDCGATGGNQIVIAPNGDVGICHGFTADKKYFPTNINDNDFDISKDSTYLEWSMRSPLNMHQCNDCPALGICGGGCPFQAEIEKGSIWDLDERFCVHAKLTLEWLIWDLLKQTQAESI